MENMGRVKSGKFGHQVNLDTRKFANSVNPDERSHQDFHCLLR